nr:secretoglobin family 2B member 2 isoform X4 [Pongo pygmaeus]
MRLSQGSGWLKAGACALAEGHGSGDACLDIDKLLANVVFDVSRDLLKEELARYNPSPLTEESFLKVQQCFANVSMTERFAHSVVIKKILQSNDCIEAAF